MGKRMKRKPPSKEKRGLVNKKESEPNELSAETIDGGEVSEVVVAVKERKPCAHLEKGIDLEALSEKIASLETERCEDCREGAGNRKGNKGKGAGKSGKKKGEAKSDSKGLWVCLACGHLACGGVGLPTSHQCHALRHARQTRHQIVAQLEDPRRQWCFPCESLVRAEKLEENGEQNDDVDVFKKVVRLIKGRTEEGSAVEASDNIVEVFEKGSTYAVRGLANLGNTCFFNSVTQNLLAMDLLRDYFFGLEGSVGPLTMAFKKLFVETRSETGTKNMVNPRAFFGCVCSKAPQFKGYQQHDSHELLRCLLDAWSSEELGMKKQANSVKKLGDLSSPVHTFVDTVFGGQVSSTVCCTECGHSSTVFEPFLDLSLPVPTKRPISKKAQQNARLKKPKLPPRRVVKNRPKLSKLVSEASSSREVPSDLQLSSDSPLLPAEEICSVAQNTPAIVESETKKEAVVSEAAEQISVSLDDYSWLDYIESEAPTGDDIHNSVVQDSEAEHKNTLNYDVPMKNGTEPEENNTMPNGIPSLTDTEVGDQVLPVNEEPDSKPSYSSVNPWEDEIPMQAQNSEVLLLPYKEVYFGPEEFVQGGEASSGILDNAQEEFDGLGDLFNEPEESSVLIGPSLNNNVSQTGFMATHSSESDPDEVDDSNSPVSVETCLTHFTKPELLSDENAWHCENCSKAHQRQKRVADKQSKAPLKSSVNGFGTGTTSDIASVNKNPSSTEAEPRNENGDSERVGVSNSSSEEHTKKENDVSHEEAQSHSNSLGSSYFSCAEESLSDRATVSGCADQEGESKLFNDNDEHEGSENSEVDSDTVKLRRDATKRVLIKKAPPILTIHLKRFSQDARGRLSKLNGHVTFRDTFDLKPYMDSRSMGEGKCNYRLVGVVEHQGTMRGGHYVAYVRGKCGAKGNNGNGSSVWFHASDAYVRETNLDEVLRSEAYILFYEKV